MLIVREVISNRVIAVIESGEEGSIIYLRSELAPFIVPCMSIYGPFHVEDKRIVLKHPELFEAIILKSEMEPQRVGKAVQCCAAFSTKLRTRLVEGHQYVALKRSRSGRDKREPGNARREGGEVLEAFRDEGNDSKR